MLTPLKLALSAAAALTGGYALHGAIDESGPTPNTPSPINYGWTLASQETGQQHDARLDKTVTIHIEGTVADVVKWLTDQGVSFVISDDNLSQKKLMINMVDQPLKDVVGAIADAMGGRWQKRGNVYAFQSAGSFPFGSDNLPGMTMDGDMKLFTPKGDGKSFMFKGDDGKEHTFVIPKFDGDQFKWLGEDGKGLDMVIPKMDGDKMTWKDKDGKVHSFNMPKMDGKVFKWSGDGKDFDMVIPKMDGDKMTWKDKDGKVHTFDMPKFDGDKMKWMGDDGKAFEFAMPKMNGDKMTWKGEDGKVRTFTMPKVDGKNFVWVDKDGKSHKMDLKGLDGKDGKPFVWSGEDGKAFQFSFPKVGKGMNWTSIGKADISKLLKSLTATQKAKMKKQGYLKASDLSASQRQMLGGLSGSGNWSFTFSQDGQKVTIKNK